MVIFILEAGDLDACKILSIILTVVWPTRTGLSWTVGQKKKKPSLIDFEDSAICPSSAPIISKLIELWKYYYLSVIMELMSTNRHFDFLKLYV